MLCVTDVIIEHRPASLCRKTWVRKKAALWRQEPSKPSQPPECRALACTAASSALQRAVGAPLGASSGQQPAQGLASQGP